MLALQKQLLHMDTKDLKIKDIKYSFEPKILSLVVTDECTAACTNCCFNCSPKKGTTMSIDDMKYYIKSSVDKFKEVKLVVLTGGEPFLLGTKSLVEIIEYTTSLNLRSRIVSNAFWATTPKKTKDYITPLVASGLSEINFSTGDEHQKFVKVGNVINACIESVRAGLTVAINVESHSESNFKNISFLENEQYKEFFSIQENSDKIKIINGFWTSINNETSVYEYNENLMGLLKEHKKGCSSIFSSFAILPTGEVVACCGLAVSEIEHFKLGNAKTDDLRLLYETQYQSFINLWIKIEGPYKIMEYLVTKEPKIGKLSPNHVCQICNLLFNNELIRNTISKYYMEKIPEILFKYQIQRSLKNL